MTTQHRAAFAVTLDAGTKRVILGRADDGTGGREGVLNGGRTAHASISASADATVAVEVQVCPSARWARLPTTHAIPAGSSRVVPLKDLGGVFALRLVGLAAVPATLTVAWSVAA